METLTKDITLGFYNETGILTVPISQGDTDRLITISLTNDGSKFEIPKDTTVFLKAEKPDGTQINTDECCSIVDNMVQIKVFKQLSIVDGIVKCELVLSDSSGKIYTTNHFNISIQKSVHADENLISSDTYKNIVEILLEIQNIKKDFVLKSELIDSVTSNSTTNAATPNSVKTVNDDLQNHKGRKDNPHDITKEQIGLENVNNTSDMDKPVSTAQQNALDSAISAHNTSGFSHNDIRLLISELTTGKVSVSDIIDDLTSTDINKPLSANQGRLLNALITELTDMINEEKDKLLPSSTADAIFATKVEVNEIKKSVSDGKTLVADAITEKGIETATNAAFATMAENISHINTGTDTSDATALTENILEGFSAYGANGKLDGTMHNNGGISEVISTKSQQVTVPVGFHDGSGKISIANAEQEKIVAANIKQGITILGVEGEFAGESTQLQSKTVKSNMADNLSSVGITYSPQEGFDGFSDFQVLPIYTQEKSVTPSSAKQTIAPDSNYDALSQVVVNAIKLQSKTVSPSTSSKTVYPDGGYNGLSSVTVYGYTPSTSITDASFLGLTNNLSTVPSGYKAYVFIGLNTKYEQTGYTALLTNSSIVNGSWRIYITVYGNSIAGNTISKKHSLIGLIGLK